MHVGIWGEGKRDSEIGEKSVNAMSPEWSDKSLCMFPT